MLIVWGKTIVRKRLGHVADFCPVCRELSSFSVFNIRRVSHLYYVPMGSGESIGHYRTCDSCSIKLPSKDGQYASISRVRGHDIVELAIQTNPRVDEIHAERLELEERLTAGRLNAQERVELMMEPFLLLNGLVEERGKNANVDRVTGLVMAVAVLATAALFVVAGQAPRQASSVFVNAGIWSLVAGVILIVVAMFGDRRRYFRRRIMPILARSLRPLKPTPEELAEVLANLGKQKLLIARSAKPHQVFAAIAGQRNDA